MLSALHRDHRARFALVGAAVTGLHLCLFSAASRVVVAEVANVIAFVVATQVNFSLSYWWTWSSRRPGGAEPVVAVLRRAAVFNGSALVAFTANAAAFSVAYRLLGVPSLLSAVLAAGASAAVSFVMSSRLTFAPAGALPRLLPPVVPSAGAAPAPLAAPAHH